MSLEYSFETWKRQVDAVLLKHTGLTSDDLPDVDYRGLYATGDTPSEAAHYVVQNAKES